MLPDNIIDIYQLINDFNPKAESNSDEYETFYKNFVPLKSIVRFNIFVEKLLLEKLKCHKQDKMMLILNDIVFLDTNLENLIYLITNETECNIESIQITKFINVLVSLPELISNLLQHNCPKAFTIKNYISRLAIILGNVLNRIHKSGTELRNFNFIYIHILVRRICLRGWQDIIFDYLLKDIFLFVINDDKWPEILRKVLIVNSEQSNLIFEETNFIESMFKIVFFNAHGPKSILKIFPFEYLETDKRLLPKIEFILTNKLVLVFYCLLDWKRTNPDHFIFNFLGYLYHHWDWFEMAAGNIMDMWANSNAFNYRTYNQQFYLCRLMIVTCRLLCELDKYSDRSKNIIEKMSKCAFNGATINLACSQSEFRAIGHTTSLILFELFLKFQSLKVELPKFDELSDLMDEDCDHLKCLASFDIKLLFEEWNENGILLKLEKKEDNLKEENNGDIKKENEFVSDDEDDPNTLSNDIPIEDDVRYTGKDLGTVDSSDIQKALLIDNSKRRPIYLEDCIEGLCEYDKPDWTERCLRASEKIIRANFFNPTKPTEFSRLDNVALNFTQTLFHLDDKFSIDNFDQLRLNSLVALCVGSPKIVASYLTEQFYTKHICIQNRLDVLAVLTMASDELSKIKPIEYPEDKVKKIEPANVKQILTNTKQNEKFRKQFFLLEDGDDDDDDDKTKKNWQEIRDSKILSQTRYISPIYSQKQAQQQLTNLNRFVPVAKHFFFPLLRDFMCLEVQINIKEEDSFIVENLIYALSVFLHNCAKHSQAMLMSKELLPFIYSYRTHQKRYF